VERIETPQTTGQEDAKLGSEAAEEKSVHPTEAIVKQWLLERDFATKLSFLLLHGYGLGDHNTEALFREVKEQYEAEILAAAENRPERLSSKETLLLGIAAEMLLSSSRM